MGSGGHRRALLRKALPSADETLASPTRPPPPTPPARPVSGRCAAGAPLRCGGAADSHSSESCHAAPSREGPRLHPPSRVPLAHSRLAAGKHATSGPRSDEPEEGRAGGRRVGAGGGLLVLRDTVMWGRCKGQNSVFS